MTWAFIFPGQGSQRAGMGRDLADAFVQARDVFEEVDTVLGEPLSTLMWEGPQEELTRTRNAQPALLAHSMAVVRVLQAHGIDIAHQGPVSCVAGHSLGEYSALAAAGTFSLAQAARLLRTRGEAMQAAVAPGDGAMAAILGLDGKTLAAAIDGVAAGADDMCEIANDNAPGQIVISGHAHAVERAIGAAKEAGAKRAVLLPVSAPFHCRLMAPAADIMRQALAEIPLQAPSVPVICNVSARPTRDVGEIERNLVDQIVGTVRWRESMAYLVDRNIDGVAEPGTGSVLSGLMRRIARDVRAFSVAGVEDIETCVKIMS